MVWHPHLPHIDLNPLDYLNINSHLAPGLQKTNLQKIPSDQFKGEQFLYTDPEYVSANQQYASTSYQKDHRMDPGLIVYPRDTEDVAHALQWAKSQSPKIPVAVRTGGHQYSGASSTDGGLLLDLRYTFTAIDPPFEKDDPTTPETKRFYVRTGVSNHLGDFNKFLGKHGYFSPHGQCEGVFLGGHVQTGGYGQLGRSFGLLGDYVVSIELVDPDSPSTNYTRTVARDSPNPEDKALFTAILGGSPGNFGILSHFTLEVHRDVDYQGAQALWIQFIYTKATLKYLVDQLVAFNDDTNKPRNFDFCVSVVSKGMKPYASFEDHFDVIEQAFGDLTGVDGLLRLPYNFIVVYAQWVPFSKDDKFDHGWFEDLKSAGCSILPNKDSFEMRKQNPSKAINMSDITSWWIFPWEREFELPYIKRTYTTNSHNLGADTTNSTDPDEPHWAEWVTNRIDVLVKDPPLGTNGCYISCQLQPFGGLHSQFYNNRNNATSYSWRDTTMCATMDAFHRAENLKNANTWQSINDCALAFPKEKNGKYGWTTTDHDRRVLWGSYSRLEDVQDFDLSTDVWKSYYDEEQYSFLREVRAQADPDGIYTPNSFCVPRADSKKPDANGVKQLGPPQPNSK